MHKKRKHFSRILTSQNSKGPSKDWINIVKTSQAKQKIGMWFKSLSKEDSIERGKQILEEAAEKKGVRLEELLKDEWKDIVLQKYGLKSFDAVYMLIGHGDIREKQVLNRLFTLYNKTVSHDITLDEVMEKSISSRNVGKKKNTSGIIVNGVDDVAVKFAKCCLPVPGDEIVGYITKGRGISVHRTDCKNILAFSSDEKRKLVEASWGTNESAQTNLYYNCDIKVISEDRAGLLVDLSKMIADSKIALRGIEAKTINKKAIFIMTVEISNKEQLERLVTNIRKVPGVEDIIRISG